MTRPMRSWRVRLTPWGFLLPAVLLTGLVILYPIVQTAWLSLHAVLLYDPSPPPFIGLGNFARAMSDEVFWIAALHSVIWIVGVVALQFVIGLGTALLLNQSFWWRGAARALVVVPWALPSVIIGLMWSWIYDFNTGVLNDLLVRTGLIPAPIAWLAQPGTALGAIMATLVWQGFPFFAVMILAGLQTVPAELYEAAALDGASSAQQFRHVTWPGITRIVATALLLRTIWVANSFDVILVMTGGGPGYVTHTLPLYAFLRATSDMEFGYGAALALILAVLLVGVVWLYLRRVAERP